MQINKLRNVLTRARVNFIQSETSSMFAQGRAGQLANQFM